MTDHHVQLALLLLVAAAAAAGTCIDMARPPRPAGDDDGPAEGRSYGAVTHPTAKKETDQWPAA